MPVAQPQFEISPQHEFENEFVVVVSRIVEHRKTIAKIVGSAFLLITLIAFLIPSEYQSTARLMPPEKPQLGGLAAMLAAAGDDKPTSAISALAADSMGLKSSGALYVGVLKSATVQDNLIDRFDLLKIYHKRFRKDARERLSAKTDVFEDRKSGIITITVTDRSPQRAELMTAEYVAKLNELTAQLNSSAAHRERLFIEDRLKSAKQDLAQADKDLSQFSSNNLTLDVKEQGKAMVEGAATLEGELIATESQLSGLEQLYTPNNVRVRSLQARVDVLKRKLSQLRGAGGLPSSTNPSEDEIGISISRLPVLGVTYYDLLRRAKIQEAVFETLTKQLELSKIEEAKELPTIKVLDSAQVPEEKSGPPRGSIIAIGTLVTCFMAMFWIWLEYRWEKLDSSDPRRTTIIGLREVLAPVVRTALVPFRRFLRKLRRGQPELAEGE